MKEPISIHPSNAKKSEISTWTNKNWPAMKEEGILGSPPVFTRQAMENRQNPNIYHVFSELMGRDDLWVSFDRYGFFRPTLGISMNGSGDLQDFPEWKSRKNIHLDRNPWNYVFNKNPIDQSFPREYFYLPEFCG